MTEKTTHAPGTFCWPELSSSNQAAAEKFYSALFGWTQSVTPMGPDSHYTIFQKNGLDVAALAALDPNMQQAGVPSNWLSYVAVTSVDDTAKLAQSLGAKVLAGPFDVMEHGRMVVLMDPQGAAFALWQAKNHAGVGLLGAPGSLVWTELATPDTKAAAAFYTKLVGWIAEPMPGPMEYTIWKRNGEDRGAGGMMELTPEMKQAGAPPSWTVYFNVDDRDATVAKTTSLGGKAIVPKLDVPGVGQIAILQDPTGAVFAVIHPEG